VNEQTEGTQVTHSYSSGEVHHIENGVPQSQLCDNGTKNVAFFAIQMYIWSEITDSGEVDIAGWNANGSIR
jgi:hypothetical protein